MIIIEICNSGPHAKSYEAMEEYIEKYGHHFNKHLLEFALNHMYKNDSKLIPYTKENIDNILSKHNIVIHTDNPCDYVYIANMCKADFLGSSIPDELYLAKFVRDYMEDEDGYNGIVFDRWYSDMYHKDIKIDWSAML